MAQTDVYENHPIRMLLLPLVREVVVTFQSSVLLVSFDSVPLTCFMT